MATAIAFAGSPDTLAAGTKIDGISVGGLSPRAAQTLLEQQSAAMARVPVIFVVGTHRFSIRPDALSVSPDWAKAIAIAQDKAGGSSLVRGFKRIEMHLFPIDVKPGAHAYTAAVNYELSLLGAKVDRAYKAARIVRHGLQLHVVEGQTGELLDRRAASKIVIAALASLTRGGPVALPTKVEQPKLTAADLATASHQAELALSGPVTLTVQQRHFELTPRQLAPMLRFPRAVGSPLVLGGHAATAYFASLDRTVGQPASGAHFDVSGDQVNLIPAQAGIGLDVPRSAAAVLAAAEQTQGRVAKLVVTSVSVGRSNAAAAAMGITGLVSSYETEYGGEANRIHNVELVAHLVDNKLIAPGTTFSFNETTGARTAAKGFLEAPVIMNGELSTGLGGGVCQVSTTVFNAAYEAGLPITSRTNHALYISHYPLGRDATVDYPDVDLKFVNDTGHWLLLRTFVGPSSLVVKLYGTPQHRKVVTETAPLRTVSPPPVQRTLVPTLSPGEHIVEDYGSPALSTSVHRLVYASDGKLLSDATWYSNYRATPKIVEIGPKPVRKVKPTPPPATTTTTTKTTGRVLQ
jgi:vancomycin resistance protein YoaR